jgi:hypothetical protein
MVSLRFCQQPISFREIIASSINQISGLVSDNIVDSQRIFLEKISSLIVHIQSGLADLKSRAEGSKKN